MTDKPASEHVVPAPQKLEKPSVQSHEKWAEQKCSSAVAQMIYAATKAVKRWAQGRELGEAEFDAALKEVGEMKLDGDRPRTAEKKAIGKL